MTKYFPPIGQQKIGDCTCWSSCYYYNTYTQARDHDLVASTGDPEVVCSPRFLFSLISQGTMGAECTEHAMERLSDVGCASVSKYSMDSHWTEWPGEEARIAALRNRTGQLHKIRVDNTDGLETVKQHIANGGCAVTRGLFKANYPAYGASASGLGINNGVMYAKVGENWLRHSLCICGYDDERSYIDDRDGQTYSGAFLIANSEGQDWGSYNSTGTGTKGFLWVAYNMFIEGEFGLYDHDDNPYTDPCFDNAPYPTIYYHDDQPDYIPSLYAVVGINHSKRNMLKLTGGIGSVNSPDFVGPEVIELTDSGEIPISDANCIVIDLSGGTHLIKNGIPIQVFVELFVKSSAGSNATITSADFYYAPKGDGKYNKYSSKDVIINIIPGIKGYATVEINIP
ncbi:MAG: hypothetical protein JXB49_24200 [Bacteroidales bacterium]|nr:hypothetical protein [Bacteroidales bacterium]